MMSSSSAESAPKALNTVSNMCPDVYQSPNRLPLSVKHSLYYLVCHSPQANTACEVVTELPCTYGLLILDSCRKFKKTLYTGLYNGICRHVFDLWALEYFPKKQQMYRIPIRSVQWCIFYLPTASVLLFSVVFCYGRDASWLQPQDSGYVSSNLIRVGGKFGTPCARQKVKPALKEAELSN